MNKIKITNHQLFSLTFNVAVGGSIIVISATAASLAKQDAWISALLTTIFGMPFIWLYWFLGSLYPGMTLIGIIRKVFGKWIGLIPSAGFVFFCLTIASHVTTDIGKFMTIQAMPETPPYIINTFFISAIVIAVLYGIETIVRASELSIYFVLILFLAAMILVLPNVRTENLLPVFEKGIIPALKGSLVISYISLFPVILLLMIYPANISNMAQAKIMLFKGYIWTGLIVFIAIIMPLLVLGSKITASFQFPAYTLAQEINVGVIFTRLEFIIAATWIVTQYFAGLIYFYAGAVGLSQLLGLSDHKRIVVPLGFIMSIMTEVVLPDAIYEINWRALVWPPFNITFGVVLPVLLILVSLIKKRVFKR